MRSELCTPFAFGVPGLQELIVIFIILGLNGLWVWSLVHCCTNKKLNDRNRIIGIILIALLNLVGSIIYLFLPRENSRSSDQS